MSVWAVRAGAHTPQITCGGQRTALKELVLCPPQNWGLTQTCHARTAMHSNCFTHLLTLPHFCCWDTFTGSISWPSTYVVNQAGLELNLWWSSCLCLSSSGILGMSINGFLKKLIYFILYVRERRESSLDYEVRHVWSSKVSSWEGFSLVLFWDLATQLRLLVLVIAASAYWVNSLAFKKLF